MKRVVAVIQTIVEKSLSFRGSNESFGSHDNSNFLGLLELIAQLDLLRDVQSSGYFGISVVSIPDITT